MRSTGLRIAPSGINKTTIAMMNSMNRRYNGGKMTGQGKQTTPNETPFVHLEHDELPTIIRQDGTVCYPFGEKRSLIFASVKEEQRWRKNISSLEAEVDVRQLHSAGWKIVGIVLALGFGVSLFFLLAFLVEIILTGHILEYWWKILVSAISIVGVAYLAILASRVEEKYGQETRSAFTYQVFTLHHPMFPKNNPLVQYGTTIFALRNRQFGSGEKQGFKERLGVSSTPLDTGESTRRMLEEHEKYLGMAGRFAELWPDADQPTRAAIAKDMTEKAEKLRTACAKYQADADRMAMINREKQDYLAQQEAETKTIMAKAKAEEAADKYRRVKAQYDS